MIETIKFKRDNHLRSTLFTPDSFKHNGKANLNLISTLLHQISPGRLIVDPMGGTGSLLIATDYQHPVISGELETHWALVSEANRKSIAGHRLIAASTPALCPQWNAKRLPLASGSIPAIITSPPYWDMLSDWHITSKGVQGGQTHELYGPAYGVDPHNIGNVHIYEDYLREMAQVYRECHRVLGPKGFLALVLKNRVHKRQVIPIVRDTVALCTALGLSLKDGFDRQVIPSLHRRINQMHYPGTPIVDTEAVLIFEKVIRPAEARQKFALVQGPKPDSAPSGQLFRKALAHAHRSTKNVFVLCARGLISGFNGLDTDQLNEPHHKGFRRRKDFAFNVCSDLVTKHGFVAGDKMEIYCHRLSYGQYLGQRLQTFGGIVTWPTEGLNLGQKLKWYTECDRALSRDAEL